MESDCGCVMWFCVCVLLSMLSMFRVPPPAHETKSNTMYASLCLLFLIMHTRTRLCDSGCRHTASGALTVKSRNRREQDSERFHGEREDL